MRSPITNLVRDGVLLRREVVAAGWEDNALLRAVRRGELVRIRQGAYADRQHWESLDEVERHRLSCTAVVRAYDADTVLSHQSAAVAHECPIWAIDLTSVHILHPTGSARRSAGIVHHQAACAPDEVEPDRPVTSPTRTALDVARNCRAESALIVVDNLLNRGLTTSALLREGTEAMLDWPGTLGHQVILRLADGRHESAGETRAAFLFWAERLPPPIPQYEVRRSDGTLVGRTDFAWPELGVIVEFDGREKYTRYLRPGESVADAVLREKAREDEIRELTGWVVIRLTWSDLRHPERAAARIRAAMRRTA